ncbi:LOW QUALITY PROTEIN: dynein axonemal heavy chain 11 [Pluvialis apricaria]
MEPQLSCRDGNLFLIEAHDKTPIDFKGEGFQAQRPECIWNPPLGSLERQDPNSRAVLHTIESTVLRRSHQIRDTVNKDSAELLLRGLHSDPQTELNGWKARKDNPLYINKQLQCPVQKIIKILKSKESSYHPASKDNFKEIEDALVEAQDIDLYLKPLEKYIQLFREMEFPKICNLIPPLFHTICLIWSCSKFYSTSVIVVLLQEFCNLVLESPEAAFVSQEYVEMLKWLDQYEDQTYCEWKVQVDETCQFDLNQPLIKHNPKDGFLSVNFGPKVVAVLREVKYLLKLNQHSIPDSALAIYEERNDSAKVGDGGIYLPQIAVLPRKVHNIPCGMLEGFNPVRVFPMTGVSQTLNLVTELCDGLIQTALEVEYPLIEKEPRTIDGLLKEAEEICTWQVTTCWDCIEQVEMSVRDLEQRVQQSKDNIRSIQGIMNAWMEHALSFRKDLLFENTEESLKPAPLFQAQMMTEIQFKPSKPLEKEAGDGFYDPVDELLGAVFRMSAQNDRDMFDLSEIRKEIMERVASLTSKALEDRRSLARYASLWLEKRSEFMKQFLLRGHGLASTKMPLTDEVSQQPPTIQLFKERIDIYENLYVQISNFEDSTIFERWFKVDTRPFKMSLLNIIKKWSWMFKGYILRFVIRQTTADEVFEPLKEVVALLESYAQKMPGEANQELEMVEKEILIVQESAKLLEVAIPDYKQWKQCSGGGGLGKKQGPGAIAVSVDDWAKTQWRQINVEQMDVELRRFAKGLGVRDEESDVIAEGNIGVAKSCNQRETLVTGHEGDKSKYSAKETPVMVFHALPMDAAVRLLLPEDTTLTDLLGLQLHRVEDEVQNIVDNTVKELGTEKILAEISQAWVAMEFSYKEHHKNGPPLIKSLKGSQNKLNMAYSVVSIWMEVQHTWSHLGSIFAGSEDIGSQLPEDENRFDEISCNLNNVGRAAACLTWLVSDIANIKNMMEVATKTKVYEKFEALRHRLSLCEKALAEYLETKRIAFPHFYFVSSADLLDIFSNGTQPKQVNLLACYCGPSDLIKLFDNIADVNFQDNIEESVNTALGVYSRGKECVAFYEGYGCSGQPRFALNGSQIWWVSDVAMVFVRLEEGLASALKGCHKKQVTQLNALITVLLGELSLGDQWNRTICTIDVHAREVVASLEARKVTSSAFALSQPRHKWDNTQEHCFANTRHAQFQYFYESLGNTPWLVITPLTDRCYITHTQSLHLRMSGTPAGPASTCKTETTKDLGHAFGMMVYIFNCSEQMDYKSIGNICKALVQTGAWGCFDKFNRISVEVLSVVTVVKTIHDAISNQKKEFLFLGENITLKSVGIFVTMNPGYTGQTELPENLKALFLCAMVVPDIELISEIMLVAEGFIDAHLLARRFITFVLCRELLSKQVLMRALRDLNLPKIVTDDIPIFSALISDLFPALDVPRKRNLQFEQMIKQSTLELPLQPEESFILKVVQLEDLLAVCHSFAVRNAGTGKSKVPEVLHHTYLNMKQKPVWNDLNTKALTAGELFSFMHHEREWRDDLLSSLLRDQASITQERPKQLGSISPSETMWIKSLKTVTDDNKVLMLKSNEHVPLTPSMWLLFEVQYLRAPTLGTVSRADILYLIIQDLGCNQYVASWMETRRCQSKKANLTALFDKYVPPYLEQLRTNFKTITPIPENSMVQQVFGGFFPFQFWATFVLTSETARLKYFIDLLFTKAKPVMLVGNAGVGKTVFVGDQLAALSEDNLLASIPFNYYTTSAALQKMLKKLEKEAGHNYGQVGNKELIYFIDDLNMPEVDRYRTVQPHALIWQRIYYGHWFYRQELTIKEICNCHYIACMNPTASLPTPRLQRHFAVFALNCPSSDSLTTIYSKIVCFHFQQHAFTPPVIKNIPAIVQAAIWLHQVVVQNFPSTAIKLPCIFNMRDLSNVFQGILFATPKYLQQRNDLQSLWLHESARVYGDKLVQNKGCNFFSKMMMDTMHKYFESVEDQVLLQSLLIYCHSANRRADPCYTPVKGWEPLRNILEEFLESCDEMHASVDLVLFEGVMQHVCISRILEAPRGYALLFGVCGSGKQSLSRLAAYICSLEVFQITLKEDYRIQDLRVALASLYIKTGAKNIPTVFLLTDAQVPDERFLVLINDLLASGEFPDLFSDEDVESTVTDFMAYAHTSVNMLSAKCNHNERRYNYTALKSFLEQLTLYEILQEKKSKEMLGNMEYLVNDMQKLKAADFQVEDLKSKLASQEAELQLRNQDAEALIAKIGFQTEKVSQEEAIADAEEQKVSLIPPFREVYLRQKECEDDLVKVEPALVSATAALNTLNKVNLTQLKTFKNTPMAVINVIAAVRVLLAYKGKVPKDRSCKAAEVCMGKVDDFLQALINYDKEHIPQNCVKVVKEHYLKDPDFNPNYVRTKSFAAAGLCAWFINIVKFNEVYCEVEPKCCVLAANTELAGTTENLEAIRKKLFINPTAIQAVVIKQKHCSSYYYLHAPDLYHLNGYLVLDSGLRELTASLEKAFAEKARCQDDVKTNKTIERANRSGKLRKTFENMRWSQFIENLKAQKQTLCGDILLTAAFVSYFGPSTKQYCQELMEHLWITFLKSQKLKLTVPNPVTEGPDPIAALTDDAMIAVWSHEGLLGDRMSTENATILTNCECWLLMIDPQQGIKWIKNKYGANLKVIRRCQKGFLKTIERPLSWGETVLIKTMGEFLDPILDPLLGRHTVKKARYIKIEDKEFNKNFHLILLTKLANPHYKPELQAQTTLINFTVTRDGLEDQLLGEVVSAEDLEKHKSALAKQQSCFRIELRQLEGDVLLSLSAQGGFLDNSELAEKRESTKPTGAEIQHKAFNAVFHKAIKQAEKSGDTQCCVSNLTEAVTYSTFLFLSQGLFEKDKLIFLAFQILLRSKERVLELDFLLRFRVEHKSPVDFLTTQSWSAIRAMALTGVFRGLDKDIERSTKRWRVSGLGIPEKEKTLQEWTNKSSLQKLIILRLPWLSVTALPAYDDFLDSVIEEVLFIQKLIFSVAWPLSHREMGMIVFCLASPPAFPSCLQFTSLTISLMKRLLDRGCQLLKSENGKNLGFTTGSGRFHNISLGQGEMVAEEALEKAAGHGHWVLFQNIHLVAKWLGTLEKLLERYSEKSHPDFRVFISAEPAPTPEEHSIPQGTLENSVKITSEPPTGMLANLHAALYSTEQDTLKPCTGEGEFKGILFSLCCFRTCVAGRLKFGPQGWDGMYPFSARDLAGCITVLLQLSRDPYEVPWEDLCYLGEITYGGHITDAWDRRLCCVYLQEFISPPKLEGELSLAPGFLAPPNLDYAGYHKYIDEMLPSESPVLYGLHPNAEMGYLTTSDYLTILEMQPMNSFVGEVSGQSTVEKVKNVLDILEMLPKQFNMAEIMQMTTAWSPYALVCLQEWELMFFPHMEVLYSTLFYDAMPDTWTKPAYPSTYSPAHCVTDPLMRYGEPEIWTQDLVLPAAVVWLSGLFNPQSFLTVVMQSMARKNWPLDKVCLTADVTKKTKEDYGHPPRGGAYICGLFMEECSVYKSKSRGPTYVWTLNLKSKEKPAKCVLAGGASLLAGQY